MERLLIVGVGGHGRSVAEAVLLHRKYLLAGFLDDAAAPGERLWDWPVLGSTSMLAACCDQVDAVIVAIGNNAMREALHRRVQARALVLATVIHPAASVSTRAVVGQGCAIMAGAVVGTGARLREGVIVNCGAVVDRDCVVEPFGHLGVNAGMAGGSVLGRRAWLPVRAALAYGAKVEEDRVLQPGEVVHA